MGEGGSLDDLIDLLLLLLLLLFVVWPSFLSSFPL